MIFSNFRIIIQSFSFISAVAAIAAVVLMRTVTKKFGTGILAAGFNHISKGVLFIALGILLGAIQDLYFYNIDTDDQNVQLISLGVFVLKAAFFVIGTYVIVVGSKNTVDKLESLTK